MNKFFHGALLFLAMLCLCSAVYAQSGDNEEEAAAEQTFNIQMNMALSNDPKAQFKVAEMYEKGTGIPQNLRMAHLWYTKSANQKYAPAIKKLAEWDNTKKEDQALAAKRAEEQKRRQVEAEAAAAAKAAQARAEEQKRRQTESEAAAAAKAAQARAEEPKRRQTEAGPSTAAKPVQAAEVVPANKEKPSEPDRSKEKTKVTTEKKAVKGEAEFRANPCNTPTAKFTSTCQ
jgi:colicin import membrane protein